MKILSHGKSYNENNKVYCSCGCVFEYSKDDVVVEYYNEFGYLVPMPKCVYITCPECFKREILYKKGDIKII